MSLRSLLQRCHSAPGTIYLGKYHFLISDALSIVASDKKAKKFGFLWLCHWLLTNGICHQVAKKRAFMLSQVACNVCNIPGKSKTSHNYLKAKHDL